MLDKDVARLMGDFGTDLTLTRQAGQTYNPTTGQLSAGTTQSFTIRGMFINYMDGKVDGTVIRAGDRRLLVQALGATVTPQVGDRVGGMDLVDVRTVAPRGAAVAWSCQARK